MIIFPNYYDILIILLNVICAIFTPKNSYLTQVKQCLLYTFTERIGDILTIDTNIRISKMYHFLRDKITYNYYA